MRQTKNIQGKKQKSIIKRTLFATLLLLVAVGVKGQAQKLGKPVSGLYNSDITAITAAASATTVVLNDLEDHNWSYYSDASCPIRSLNPADVTITYYGNGTGTVSTTNNSATPGNNSWTQNASGVQISYNETANTFVYYKTLERTDGSTSTNPTGRCAYTTIPNPFSKRPTYGTGDTRWRGFYAWRVRSVSGGTIHTAATGGTQINAGGTIDAETEVFFAPTASTGMTVELEALWARAYVVEESAYYLNTNGYLNSNDLGANSYERNFYVLTGNYSTNADVNRSGQKPVTITTRYPDGTSSGATGQITRSFTYNADTKFEYVTFNAGNRTFTANNHDLIVGRGCTGTVNILRGMGGNTTSALNYIIRLESGVFNYVSFTAGYYTNADGNQGSNNTFSGRNNNVRGVLGCDYERAVESSNSSYNYANAPLRVTYNMIVGATPNLSNQTETEFFNTTIKSGYYGSGFTGLASGSVANSFYLGMANTFNTGKRKLTIEGGRLNLSLAGGIDEDNTSDDALIIRMKGGTVAGAVYGAAAFSSATGGRRFIFTGGNVGGWIAGGANGTQTTGGKLDGKTFIYFGGTAQCNSNGSTTTIGPGNATGGNIFGAGSGNSGAEANATVGEVDQSTVVIADNAYVERNVYGGGNYGYVVGTGTENKSDMYILGGTVDGNVFGGSNMQKGNIVNYYVKDGTVKGGIYGGSNARGNLSGNVTMSISGGTIEGGVYGGGYGTTSNSCDVNGTVGITMTGGTVLSGLYGGGNVNSKIGGKTTVNVNGGTVGASGNEASVFGGGLGSLTRAKGDVEVNIGSIDGSGNAVIYGDVYGGSAKGKTNCNDGGTARNGTTKTDVTLNGGTIHGSLYGGGLGDDSNEADVWGTVTVVVNGGSVKEVAGKTGSGAVYGCNNVSGRPMQNDVTVTVNGTDAAADGEYAIDNVFGGGNAAAYIGNPVVTIAGTKTNCVVGNVYGGGLGSTATVTGNSTVKMNNGRAKNLFGGDSQADLTGGVTMSVTGGRVDNDVYGGGALADTNTSGGTTSVSLTGGTVGNAYGGGLGAKTGINGATADVEAIVNGNVTVEVNGTAFLSEIDSEGIVTKGRVFGCNNLNGTPKGTVTVHVYKTVGLNGADKPERNTNKYEIQAVYGGGNLAAYRPTASNTATKVIIDGCGLSSIAYVYGGGNAAPVPATNVTVNGSYEIDYVFGGGNGKDKILINGVYEENPGADVGKVNGVSYGTTDPIGTTTTTIYGGVIHHVFGGSNTKGDVTKEAHVILGDQNLQTCEFKVGEVYGAGNEAYMSGSANIKLNCIEGLTEIYGGSRRADIDKDVNLTINGGRYEKVFGGNNESGCIRGSITVTIQENGCLPIYIDELYLGGNEAAYSVYGYKDDKSPKTEGTALYDDPVLNVISATEIGEVYGGVLGNTAIMYGNPHVNINMEPGKVNGKYKYVATNTEHPEAVSPAGYDTYDETQNTSATFPLKLSLGNIGTVFGGGNAAKVVGDTHIQIGTGLAADGTTALKQTDDDTKTRHDAQISGNVYGGGNQAEVTGKTNVVIGHE